MIEMVLGVITATASVVASVAVVVKLLRHWDLQISCVRWLFFIFFVYLVLWASSRAVLFAWLLTFNDDELIDRHVVAPLTTVELDRLGVHAIPITTLAHDPWLAAITIIGDTAQLGVALWLFLLTYELSKIATNSMDRGPEREHRRIIIYNVCGHTIILAYVCSVTGIAIRERGYTLGTHYWLLGNYVFQVLGLGYMLVALLVLKCRGRKYETDHVGFVISPVYTRLKRIMIVYGVFATPYHVASVIMCLTQRRFRFLTELIGVGMIVFNGTGLALAILTGCSQVCVLRVCAPCLPEAFEPALLQRRFRGPRAYADEVINLEPPRDRPVFVATDIESSSALWAVAPVVTMEQATALHDAILRESLPRHRGYEITTCGDSFQLVFHTIADAVGYCVDVQLQLLTAAWPKGLHGLVPATRRQRCGHRLVFNGLRVRMGIHATTRGDGPLVCTRHAITGKMTYTGVAEIIATELGELGHGGQILVTQRVADWFHRQLQWHHQRQGQQQQPGDHVAIDEDASGVIPPEPMDVECVVEPRGRWDLEHLAQRIEIFELCPIALLGRHKLWRASRAIPAMGASSPRPAACWSRRSVRARSGASPCSRMHGAGATDGSSSKPWREPSPTSATYSCSRPSSTSGASTSAAATSGRTRTRRTSTRASPTAGCARSSRTGGVIVDRTNEQ